MQTGSLEKLEEVQTMSREQSEEYKEELHLKNGHLFERQGSEEGRYLETGGVRNQTMVRETLCEGRCYLLLVRCVSPGHV